MSRESGRMILSGIVLAASGSFNARVARSSALVSINRVNPAGITRATSALLSYISDGICAKPTAGSEFLILNNPIFWIPSTNWAPMGPLSLSKITSVILLLFTKSNVLFCTLVMTITNRMGIKNIVNNPIRSRSRIFRSLMMVALSICMSVPELFTGEFQEKSFQTLMSMLLQKIVQTVFSNEFSFIQQSDSCTKFSCLFQLMGRIDERCTGSIQMNQITDYGVS